MLRTAEEIIKSKYPFYDENIIMKDVELNGEQVSNLINEARKEAIEEFAKRVTLHFEGEGYPIITVDKESILSLIEELK